MGCACDKGWDGAPEDRLELVATVSITPTAKHFEIAVEDRDEVLSLIGLRARADKVLSLMRLGAKGTKCSA